MATQWLAASSKFTKKALLHARITFPPISPRPSPLLPRERPSSISTSEEVFFPAGHDGRGVGPHGSYFRVGVDSFGEFDVDASERGSVASFVYSFFEVVVFG